MEAATISSPIAKSSFSDEVDSFNELDSPRSITTTTINGREYALIHAYSDDGVQIVDITCLSNPTPVAALEDGSKYIQLESQKFCNYPLQREHLCIHYQLLNKQ